ncbi:MAG: AMP-binding protein [Deltaproteobacteria bacterium]|nr:AMP-binding protein [Deltaproteobacteria bacterium]
MKNKFEQLIKETHAFKNRDFDSREAIRAMQDTLLSHHVTYAANHSPYYKALFKKLSINAESIKSAGDLSKIPCIAKKELTSHNNEFLAISENDTADICLTSATTGNHPTVIYQSSEDIARLAYNEEAAFRMVGINNNDRIMVCAAIDRCFMAGLAYYLGGLTLGSTMIRAGSGSPAQQWELIKTTKPTVLAGVPSLIRKLGQFAKKQGEDPKSMGIRKIVAIGEPIRSTDLKLLPVPHEVETLWGARLYSTYASTEMATAFCECRERCGGHLRPELLIAEIVDDEGNPLPPGEKGEVTVTPLGIKGMPLLRFRTGDISFIIPEPCRCGRNTIRLGPIIGRKNQMLKLKGTTLFPASLLSALDSMKGVEGGYIEARKNDDETDRVLLHVALSDPAVTVKMIVDHIRAKARVVPEIFIIKEEELNKKIFPPEKRKKMTFFDYR